jgi:hypothetical protein
MIESVIASSHYYYVNFFDCPSIKSVSAITKLLSDTFEIEPVSKKNKNLFHLQVLIEKQYGSERVLIANQVKKRGRIYFWYDLYIGKVEGSENIFFICYPYNKIKEYLARLFSTNNLVPDFHKPLVKNVLEKMESGYVGGEQDFTVHISKYSAQVISEPNANRVNIIGQNPLNSKVYNLLKDNKIPLKTTSLKLRCTKTAIGTIEISFDRLGNYRFWIKRDAADFTIPLLSNSFRFFEDMEALEIDSYMSIHTLLETED